MYALPWLCLGMAWLWAPEGEPRPGLTRLLPTLSEREQADLAAEVRGVIERFRVGDGYRLPGLALGVAARAAG